MHGHSCCLTRAGPGRSGCPAPRSGPPRGGRRVASGFPSAGRTGVRGGIRPWGSVWRTVWTRHHRYSPEAIRDPIPTVLRSAPMPPASRSGRSEWAARSARCDSTVPGAAGQPGTAHRASAVLTGPGRVGDFPTARGPAPHRDPLRRARHRRPRRGRPRLDPVPVTGSGSRRWSSVDAFRPPLDHAGRPVNGGVQERGVGRGATQRFGGRTSSAARAADGLAVPHGPALSRQGVLSLGSGAALCPARPDPPAVSEVLAHEFGGQLGVP